MDTLTIILSILLALAVVAIIVLVAKKSGLEAKLAARG